MLTFGSLFAGIGGFDLGFERAEMVCKWQVEIDKHCREVLDRHWPDVPKYGDVKDAGRKQLEPVDVICGGFPCQDVSVAGRREGLAGERSGLWFEFLRVIEELEPEWVVIENVPGLLSSNGGRDMATIVGGLAECGYWWAYRVLDLQWFGVPQRRRRVFIVGSLTRGRAQQVLFDRESSPWDIAPGRETGEGIANGTGENFKKRGGFGWSEYEVPTGTLEHEGGTHQGGPERVPFVINGYSETGQGWWGNGIAPLRAEGENRPSRPSSLVAYGGNNTTGSIDAATARNAHGSNRYDFESETFVCAFDWRAGDDSKWHTGPNGQHPGGGAKEIVRQGDYTGALNSTRQDAVAGNFGVRRLTPTECERLQGFPDGHTEGQSDSARYRQLGNAVGVPHSEWLGQRLVEAEDIEDGPLTLPAGAGGMEERG